MMSILTSEQKTSGDHNEQWFLGRRLVALDHWPPKGDLDLTPDDPTPARLTGPTVARLNWAIEWHTIAHRQADRWYKTIKTVGLAAGAAIPVLSVINGDSFKVWVASLGALIVVLEGIQQLKKYGQNALLWSQGKEALKREYYRFRARIAPYACDDEEAKKMLADRIEQIIGQEISKWAENQTDTLAPRSRVSERAEQ